MLWFLFFWWTFAGILWLLNFPPGPFEAVISCVLSIAGAAVATYCLRQCWSWLPRKKIQQRGLVIPPKGASFLTKYERAE